MKTESILGDSESLTKRLIRSLCHFILGASFGLFFAVIVISSITIAPHANHLKIVSTLLLIFCTPPGLLFVALGLFGNGKLINGLFRVLGRHVDPGSM
jgi:hypothetical protein